MNKETIYKTNEIIIESSNNEWMDIKMSTHHTYLIYKLKYV